ncbi:hypothetical protein PsorP6_013846 [Peronosclerospora sorghi]|uniref:Uncharacterized protein n=1 Tax=Peronosclerospora sorghi TaxID=230839 RepID=A0ACC0VGD2_9STRA|nr:hypothetical protein PsorP6_013846 [Peronosclerospora sorghi]
MTTKPSPVMTTRTETVTDRAWKQARAVIAIDLPRSKRGPVHRDEREDGQAQASRRIPDDNDDDGPSFPKMDGASIVIILLWLLLAVEVYFRYSRHYSLAFQQKQYHQLAQHEGTRARKPGTGRVDDSSGGM